MQTNDAPPDSPRGSAHGPGRVLAMARRVVRKGPLLLLEEAEISTGRGVEGDLRGKPGTRQVTVLSASAWQAACALLGADLPWVVRRANLLVDGLDLRRTGGRVLCLGSSIELLVTGELEPCARMDAAAKGLRLALSDDWRGGLTCRVLRGGLLSPGCPAWWAAEG